MGTAVPPRTETLSRSTSPPAWPKKPTHSPSGEKKGLLTALIGTRVAAACPWCQIHSPLRPAYATRDPSREIARCRAPDGHRYGDSGTGIHNRETRGG